ncbi:hypothetical protein SHIRM173S_11269 [Streptomyces hirsutus]
MPGEALGEQDGLRFATAAFGGGTPTFLTAAELERLCDIAEHRMGADLRAVPLSVEASPATVTADRLEVLAARGTSPAEPQHAKTTTTPRPAPPYGHSAAPTSRRPSAASARPGSPSSTST